MLIIRNKPLAGHFSTIYVSRNAKLLGIDYDKYRGMCVSVLDDFNVIPEQARTIIIAKADYDTIDVPAQFLEYIGSYTYRTGLEGPAVTYHAFHITEPAAVRRESMSESNRNERINSDAE